MLDIMDISINFTPATTKCNCSRVDCHWHCQQIAIGNEIVAAKREGKEGGNVAKLHLQVALQCSSSSAAVGSKSSSSSVATTEDKKKSKEKKICTGK